MCDNSYSDSVYVSSERLNLQCICRDIKLIMCYFLTVTVRFSTTVVRDDESAESLTFILVTNRPADTPFTVQVCTEDTNDTASGMATGNGLIYYPTIKSVKTKKILE